MQHNLRILGIDPGSNATGYGVVERVAGSIVHVAHGTIRPPAKQSLAVRLAAIQRELHAAIEVQRPDVLRSRPISKGEAQLLAGPDGGFADFRIDGPEDYGVGGLVNLFGIESPGLTSCLAIAGHVLTKLDN